MKYLLIGLGMGLVIGTLFGMILLNKDHKKPDAPKEGQVRIVGVFINPKGEKQIDIIIRQIAKKVIYDSLKREDRIKMDTSYGYPVDVKGKDSNGKDSTYRVFKIIGKDSINTNIENINIDSLLKK